MGRLRETFGEDAELYDRVRPSYPIRVYDDVARMLGPVARPRVLEIGCGTGQATAPMVRRGWSVKAVELSPALGGIARDKLPELEVIVADFDTEGVSGGSPPTARHSARHLAAREPSSRCFASQRSSPAHRATAPSTCSLRRGTTRHPLPLPAERFDLVLSAGDSVTGDEEEIAASGRFEPAQVRRYEWESTYSAAEYLDLLSSYSGHRALTEQARDGLYTCIRALIEASYGSVTKRYLTLLTAANRLHQPLALG